MVGALSVLVGATAAVGLPDGAAVTPSAAEARKNIAWRSCGDELQCARVRVPLNWDRFPSVCREKLAYATELPHL